VKKMRNTRVLAIGMVDSIHFGRWLTAAQRLPAKFTIFPSGPNRLVSDLISALSPEQFRISKWLVLMSLPVWILDRVFGGRVRAVLLWAYLKIGRYDIIHYHEMQSGGYPLIYLPTESLRGVKVLYTPYGSDIFWFRNYRGHAKKLRKVLGLTSGIFPECERDISLAHDHGFDGEVFDSMPASGVMNTPIQGEVEVDSRNKITLKGYGGRWGRAIVALRSLEQIQHSLSRFEINITSATRDVAREVKRLQASSSLNLVLHPKFSLSTSEMGNLLVQSKYHIALSLSDGFPASLMEALTQGAIPIQSDTACIPKSLQEICEECFLGEGDWSEVGKTLLRFEDRPVGLKPLSDRFIAWTKLNNTDRKEFQAVVSKAYGINP